MPRLVSARLSARTRRNSPSAIGPYGIDAPAVTARSELHHARRIIIEIGSRTLTTDADLIPRLARQIAALSNAKRSFVIVSSGAIAIRYSRLGYKTRPKEVARLQAAAAAGQSVLDAPLGRGLPRARAWRSRRFS